MSGAKGILVTDFDSTVTRHDFYELVRRRWPVPPGDDPWEKYVAGTLTHFEALAEIFSRVRASEKELLGVADAMEVFPDFASTVRALQAGGWEVIVASAGCRWYIDYLLARQGVEVTVYSNPGTFNPARGLLMHLPEHGEFFSPETGVNKQAIVRDALRRAKTVAFAGDGRPDFEPSLLVPPDRRFARGWLAEALTSRGEKFHPLKNWTTLREALGC
jgi:2-hydroxy-3-keto-5-methylthiopentenyl-1-phosphate phosphatase